MAESVFLAMNSLIINKLRTFLSLLGITIGIFAIISVFTVIDSLEMKIRDSVASLGSNVVYVQKWPWGGGGGEYPWWKYLNRPVPKLAEKKMIDDMSQLAKNSAFMVFSSKKIQYGGDYAKNIEVIGTSPEYEQIRTFEMQSGRWFAPFESHNGRNVCVMGATIADELMPGIEPVGKTIKIGANKVTVVGVFEKQGEDMFGMSADKQILVPINFAKSFIDIKSEQGGPMIMVAAKDGITNAELIDELRGVMRTIRKLKPLADDDFALNETDILSKAFDQLFSVIDVAGLIIGGFSILVGGFGIANIMFVSVKEQTKNIGIQKALGARRSFILIQFLAESVMLSLVGGILGLLIIWFGTFIVEKAFDFELALTTGNILLGLGISVSIGIISGFAPAYTASKLDPVVAISMN